MTGCCVVPSHCVDGDVRVAQRDVRRDGGRAGDRRAAELRRLVGVAKASASVSTVDLTAGAATSAARWTMLMISDEPGLGEAAGDRTRGRGRTRRPSPGTASASSACVARRASPGSEARYGAGADEVDARRALARVLGRRSGRSTTVVMTNGISSIEYPTLVQRREQREAHRRRAGEDDGVRLVGEDLVGDRREVRVGRRHGEPLALEVRDRAGVGRRRPFHRALEHVERLLLAVGVAQHAGRDVVVRHGDPLGAELLRRRTWTSPVRVPAQPAAGRARRTRPRSCSRGTETACRRAPGCRPRGGSACACRTG